MQVTLSGVQSSANSYYAFIGLPNAGNYTSTWDSDPPAPKMHLVSLMTMILC